MFIKLSRYSERVDLFIEESRTNGLVQLVRQLRSSEDMQKKTILAFKVALQLSILQPSIARLICRKWGFSANKKRKVAGLTQANKAMRL